RTAPDQLRRLMREGEALAAARRRLSEPGEAIDIGLLRRDLARRDILDDRIGARRTEGNAMELRDADHVAHRVAQPVRMIALEKVGLADRERIDRAQIDRHVVAGGERAISPDRKIAVRRAKGPEKVGGQSHPHILPKNAPRASGVKKFYTIFEAVASPARRLNIIAIAIICCAMSETIGFLLNDTARLFRRAFNARTKGSGITAL